LAGHARHPEPPPGNPRPGRRCASGGSGARGARAERPDRPRGGLGLGAAARLVGVLPVRAPLSARGRAHRPDADARASAARASGGARGAAVRPRGRGRALDAALAARRAFGRASAREASTQARRAGGRRCGRRRSRARARALGAERRGRRRRSAEHRHAAHHRGPRARPTLRLRGTRRAGRRAGVSRRGGQGATVGGRGRRLAHRGLGFRTRTGVGMTKPAFESLADVIADEAFPDLDLALRRGRHVDRDDGPWYALLSDGQAHLEVFYRRYGCELVYKSDGYYYLLPTANRLGRRHLSPAEMLVGQGLTLLYLDPSTVQTGGVVTREQLLAQLANVLGPEALVRSLNPKRRRYDERVAEETVRQKV